MNQEPATASQSISINRKNPQASAIPWIARLGSFTPRRLFTSQPDLRNAIIIMMLCAPALMLFVGTTVPTMVFESPEQQAYFYFASIFSQDLSSNFFFVFAALCMVIALALPAPKQDSHSTTR